MSVPRRYSKVFRRVWNDEKFRRLSAPPPNAQTLWLRLLSGPELSNIPGLIVAGEAGLSEALGWTVEGFRKAFAEVSREGLAKADWKARLVWVPNAIRHNEPESPNVVASWGIIWDEAPECALKYESWCVLRAYCEGRGEPWRKAFEKACAKPSAKPSGNQEQEQEQEQEQDTEGVQGVSAPASPPARRPREPRDTSPSDADIAAAIRAEIPAMASLDPKITGNRKPIGTLRAWAKRRGGDPLESIRLVARGACGDGWLAERGYPLAAIAKRPDTYLTRATAPKPANPRGMAPAASHEEHAEIVRRLGNGGPSVREFF